MVTRGTTKRKRLANGGEKELSNLDSKKNPKSNLATAVKDIGKGKGRNRRKDLEDDMEDLEDEDEEKDAEIDDENDDDDDDGSQSQKRQMMLFEKRLNEIKKNKKSTSENNATRFKKKVKLQEEALINSLQEQRTKMKTNTSNFSKTLTNLIHDAFNSSFSKPLAESTTNPPNIFQNHQLHAPQISAAVLSTKFLASAQSLQETLTAIAECGLTLGEGWEQDGDLSISILRQTHKNALAELTEMISKDGGGNTGRVKENTQAVAWKRTVKKSTRGISSLLRNLPVSPIGEEE